MACVTAMLKPGVSTLRCGVSNRKDLRNAASVEIHEEEEHAQRLCPGAMFGGTAGVRVGGRGFCVLLLVVFLGCVGNCCCGWGRMPHLELGRHGGGDGRGGGGYGARGTVYVGGWYSVGVRVPKMVAWSGLRRVSWRRRTKSEGGGGGVR